MEDMADSVPGDQVAGCTVDQAAVALDELAELHAPLWGDPVLRTYDWLDRSTPDSRGMHRALLQTLWDGFRERYDDRLDPEVVELGEVFVTRLEAFLEHEPPAPTVQHGDYRLDNLLFGQTDGSPPVCVVDWQTVSLGAGLSDVVLLLRRRPPARRPAGPRAGARGGATTAALTGLGVEGYDWDQALGGLPPLRVRRAAHGRRGVHARASAPTGATTCSWPWPTATPPTPSTSTPWSSSDDPDLPGIATDVRVITRLVVAISGAGGGGACADAVRRLSDPSDGVAGGAPGGRGIPTSTTGTSSTATGRTCTSAWPWATTPTGGSSTLRSAWCTTACSARCSLPDACPPTRRTPRWGPSGSRSSSRSAPPG